MEKPLWEFTKEDWEEWEEWEEVCREGTDFDILDSLTFHEHQIQMMLEKEGKPNDTDIRNILEDDADVYLMIIKRYKLEDKLSDKDLLSLLLLFDNIKYQPVININSITFDLLPNSLEIFSKAILLLKHGKNIKLSADIPNKGSQDIEINGYIKDYIISLLDDSIYETMHTCFFPNVGFDKKPFSVNSSDEVLKTLAEEEEKKRKNRIKTIGRERKYLPRLGKFISDKMKQNDLFSKLNKTEGYCLIGDFLVYNKQLTSYTWEDWEILDNHDKQNYVRYWIKSYKNLSKDEASGSQQE